MTYENSNVRRIWTRISSLLNAGFNYYALRNELEFPSEFESIFETALDHEHEDQLGTYGEINLDKKISRCCPF